MSTAALILDSSVFIKWYRQGEVLAERALVLRKAYLEGQLTILAPTLCLYELANVLRYKDDLTTEEVQSAVQSMFDIGVEWISPSREILNKAIEIARTYHTTVYDAVFVALATILDMIFITADKRLADGLVSLPAVKFLGELDIEFLTSP